MAPNPEETLTHRTVLKGEQPVKDSGRSLLAIDGKWYDVTSFIPHHPGGDIISEFIGKDATDVFFANHPQAFELLKHRKPVGDYISKKPPSKAMQEYRNLLKYFAENDFYYPSKAWLLEKWSLNVAILCMVIYGVVYSSSLLVHCFCGLGLAWFWQRCGFFLHDFQHSQIFKSRFWNRVGGFFCGTVSIGINSDWWREEHYAHHNLTNTLVEGVGVTDPQMTEEVWAQNDRLLQFFNTGLRKFLVKIQYLTFIPLAVVFGRPAVIIDAFHLETRWYQWAGLFLHFAWTGFLLSYLPNWTHIGLMYLFACLGEGVLHVQLILNHYSKPFHDRDETMNMNFFEWQCETCQNIQNPEWLDFFHGGLNLHIEHHLFPKLPRSTYRQVQKMVKDICKRNNIHYDEVPFFQTVLNTLSNLKRISDKITFKDIIKAMKP